MIVGEEVEVEARRGVFGGADEGHSHDVLVEVEAFVFVLDADHGVVEEVLLRVCFRDLLCLF